VSVTTKLINDGNVVDPQRGRTERLHRLAVIPRTFCSDLAQVIEESQAGGYAVTVTDGRNEGPAPHTHVTVRRHRSTPTQRYVRDAGLGSPAGSRCFVSPERRSDSPRVGLRFGPSRDRRSPRHIDEEIGRDRLEPPWNLDDGTRHHGSMVSVSA
jgi:hypothetical protein